MSTGDLAGALTLDTTNDSAQATTSSASSVLIDSGWGVLNASITPKGYIAPSIGIRRTGVNNGTAAAGCALWFRFSS